MHWYYPSGTVGGERKINAHPSQHQLQLTAGTTDYRARLTGDLQSPGHYSTNHWQPPSLAAHVNPKTKAGFSSIHSVHDCGITSTPKAPRKSVNSPLLAGKKKPKCSKAAAEQPQDLLERDVSLHLPSAKRQHLP